MPIHGTSDSRRRPIIPRASATPTPVDSSPIDTAVAAANSASAATPCVVSDTAPTSSTPAAAEPPTPCTSPIPNAAAGERPCECACGRGRVPVHVHVRMGVDDTVVHVGVRVEVAAPPAVQQPHGEDDDHAADRQLGGLLHALRQRVADQHDGQAAGKERERVPAPPGEPEPARPRGPVTRVGDDQRGHRRQVIGVGGVAQAEQDGHQQRDDDAAAAEPGQRVVEPAHQTRRAAATAAWP